MFGSLKALFYGGTKGFRPHEKRCLAWFAEQLPEEGRKTLQAQTEIIDVIQRGMRDQEVACFFPKQVRGNAQFPNQGFELPTARVALRAAGQPPILCEIFFHGGLIHQLQYSSPPKLWRDTEFSLERIELFADLMKPDTRERNPPIATVSLPAKLQEGNAKDFAAPAPESEIDILVRRLGPALPQDYVDLLRITDGFEFELWTVNGLRTSTRTVDDVGTCTWLAEGESLDTSPKSLVILHKDTLPKVYMRDEASHDFTEMGSSFIDALLNVAIEKTKDEPDESPEEDTDSWPPAPKA
jgi:hypothetical protein